MASVVEIADGNGFSRSVDGGALADTATRSWRVVRGSPSETFNPDQVVGVFVGDSHPSSAGLICTSVEGRFEGSSRMVALVTATYRTRATSNLEEPAGGSAASPDQRPPNWSTSTSTYESPIWYWRKVVSGTAGEWLPAANEVGDMVDGVSRLQPIITLSVEQFQAADPLIHAAVVGTINSQPLKVGAYTFPIATVLLRGIQASATVEAFGGGAWRGWKCAFEFSCKANPALIHSDAGVGTVEQIGWDIAVPHTGFNVKAFNPQAPGADDDPYGQPLKHSNYKIVAPLELPETYSAGDKVRAMVKVFSYEGGGASQTPSAQPIPLNINGRPRKESATPKVLVRRYRVYDEYDFNNLGLRLG